MILKDTKFTKCGCIYERQGIVWCIKTYCKEHTPNFNKKSDRIYRLEHKKTGRGYTKSPKKLNDR